MLPLDLLEFEVQRNLEVALKLAAAQRRKLDATEESLTSALDNFEEELAEYNSLIDAIQECQRRIARIRDTRENL